MSKFLVVIAATAALLIPSTAQAKTNWPAGTYSAKRLVQLAEAVGLRGEGAIRAAATALSESRGQSWVQSATSDTGLWQINWVHGYSVSDLKRPGFNAQVMARLSNHGRNWQPWAGSAYWQWMSAARRGYAQVHLKKAHIAEWPISIVAPSGATALTFTEVAQD